jgi:hypothetical protein
MQISHFDQCNSKFAKKLFVIGMQLGFLHTLSLLGMMCSSLHDVFFIARCGYGKTLCFVLASQYLRGITVSGMPNSIFKINIPHINGVLLLQFIVTAGS